MNYESQGDNEITKNHNRSSTPLPPILGEQILMPRIIHVKECKIKHSGNCEFERGLDQNSLNHQETFRRNGTQRNDPGTSMAKIDLVKLDKLSKSLEVKEFSTNLSYLPTISTISNREISKELSNNTSDENENDGSFRGFESNANRNSNKFKITNTSESSSRKMDVNCHSSVKHIGEVIVCLSSFLSLTLIPCHDVIILPDYWYETIFHWVFGGIPCFLGIVITRINMIFEDHENIDNMSIFQIYLSASITFAASHIFQHLIWSEYLEYNSPMPFILFTDGYLSILAFWIFLWYKIPTDMKGNIRLRNRLISYYWFEIWVSSLPLQVMFLLRIFSILNEELQWITAIMIAIQKFTNNKMMEKFISIAVESDRICDAIGITTTNEATVYKMAVIILIGSKANAVTGYCILAVTFLMNIYICFKAIRLHRQSVEDENQSETLERRKSELLIKLMLNEMVESITPLLFIIAFIIAYFGPNARIIGNIQNGYWQFKAVNDIQPYLSGILMMAIVDLSSVVISLHLLWGFCRIDGLKFAKEKIGRFGSLILFNMFSAMNFVRIISCCFHL